jgi:hypothetical protein
MILEPWSQSKEKQGKLQLSLWTTDSALGAIPGQNGNLVTTQSRLPTHRTRLARTYE